MTLTFNKDRFPYQKVIEKRKISDNDPNFYTSLLLPYHGFFLTVLELKLLGY